MHKLFELLAEYDTVTIFRHVNADGDALGSQFGLKTFIEDHFPEKQVYALGESIGSLKEMFPAVDNIDDSIISNSLAIICDTANMGRVDDQRFKLAKQVVKIDHHIEVEHYGDLEIVNSKASATCEVVTKLLKDNNFKLSKQCASYLYCGLITDTNGYSVGNVSLTTFECAAYLVECGVDVAQVNRELKVKSIDTFRFENFIANKMQISGKVAYAIIDEADYTAYNQTYSTAKEKVYVLAGLAGISCWCLFTQNGSSDLQYSGSLRSKITPIDKIANKYHGGGHALACGVKHLEINDIQALIGDINNLVG